MNDVLLTYGWVRSSYAALRNLAGHNLKVFCADSYPVGMCQWSRYKSGFMQYPSHYKDEEAFIDAISRACETRGISLIFPSHNETEILARHKDKLPARTTALLPDAAHCRLFNNKSATYELVKSLGVPVPARLEYREPAAVAHAIREAGFSQSVIKLLTGNSAKGVFYADTPEEAQAIVLKLVADFGLTADRYPQIEERVYGEGAGCSVLYWHGEPVASFGHRRLREKIKTGGTSTLRESMHHLAIESAAHAVFRAVGWHGLAMAEFKLCPHTGKFWFIEINPRMWGSIPLAINAGVEFPYLAWLCATEGPDRARHYHSQCSVRYPWRGRWLLGDMMLAATQVAKRDFRDAWLTLFDSRSDCLDDFYLDDPLAFLGEIGYYGSRFLSTLSTNPAEDGMVG
jgi:predicted ATP-grasp superfamily ATP-dependent carboligase